MKKDDRTVREYALKAGPSEVRAAAARLLAPRRSKLKPKSKRPTKLNKAEKDRSRNGRMSGYHAKVRARSEGDCELPLCLRAAAEQHHIIYGTGLRKAMESERTLIDLCREHHDLAHASDLEVLAKILAWARMSCFGLAAGACEHRINKKLRVIASTPSLRVKATP